ncbi:hypothetical protein BGW36DRAFT_285640 [Talaromyces proteolyticus]|uniref:Mitochondrial distribution and morphology protein 10 n=1 Tax=Talaromyces proteolyticus TaxID=1131652 RepID=A0AAD4Q179_9EURO|nr:uncharacterized protein BGW36DRAFT_285640 [Talaromyces proteolyticus]KAH8705340.1 hypothetical protein BGW36DRAFT_285640 [Talaromyces proteolyticus]
MLEFMDYIQLAFAEATRWNRDNSYSSLTATAESLLDFHVPERLQVHLSSLSTPHFATSYTLGTVGLIDGSVSYLFSTVPLNNTASESGIIPLRKLVHGYRQIEAPIPPIRNWGWDAIPSHQHISNINSTENDDLVRKATLLHATLHLPPPSTLTALFLRRISPTTQLTAALVSTQGTPLAKSAPQAALLTQISHDTGRFSNEYLFSTDNALFGWRGLWNIGLDDTPGRQATDKVSLLSAGAEAYYSPISSLVGLSTGLKFTTLPAAATTYMPSSSSSGSGNGSPISSFPYTLTLTLTPLTGALSTTYSVRASPNLAFSSRFGFNVYSWESEMVAGCEIWRKSRRAPEDDGLEWARRKMAIASPTPTYTTLPTSKAEGEEEEGDSVVKIRVDQSWNVRVLWEGRVKSLLVTAGVSLGPGSFSSLSSVPPSPTTAPGAVGVTQSSQSAGGGASSSPMPSYWRGVGVSVLYSS